MCRREAGPAGGERQRRSASPNRPPDPVIGTGRRATEQRENRDDHQSTSRPHWPPFESRRPYRAAARLRATNTPGRGQPARCTAFCRWPRVERTGRTRGRLRSGALGVSRESRESRAMQNRRNAIRRRRSRRHWPICPVTGKGTPGERKDAKLVRRRPGILRTGRVGRPNIRLDGLPGVPMRALRRLASHPLAAKPGGHRILTTTRTREPTPMTRPTGAAVVLLGDHGHRQPDRGATSVAAHHGASVAEVFSFLPCDAARADDLSGSSRSQGQIRPMLTGHAPCKEPSHSWEM